MVSDLISGIIESPNFNPRNGREVRKITIHHMAGVMSAEQCGHIFEDESRQGSSNYGIGVDGDIFCYVGEENRAWTSSSPDNDYQAITMEVSNSECGREWPVSDASFESMINLCVDICRRYGFRLEYTGDENGTLTEHRMFAATACPGPYLHERMSFIADEVNRRLDFENPESETYSSPITVTAHVADRGWLEPVNDSETAGTIGDSRPLEAFKIHINRDGVWANYSAHISGIGWGVTCEEDEVAGTTGEGRPLEAIRVNLIGECASMYNVFYRVHAANYGWMSWVKNGEEAGTTGLATHIEAIQVCVRTLDEGNPSNDGSDTDVSSIIRTEEYDIIKKRR